MQIPFIPLGANKHIKKKIHYFSMFCGNILVHVHKKMNRMKFSECALHEKRLKTLR